MEEVDGKIDPASPYFLGSGDQPGNLITHVILQKDTNGSRSLMVLAYNNFARTSLIVVRLKAPHPCSCGLFKCGVVAHYETDWEEERLYQFFMGIDDELYGVVRSNLLSRVPMSSLDEAYNVLQQDENSKNVAQGTWNLTLIMLLLFHLSVPCLEPVRS
ncbi:hypothetical protein LIER_32220 [Lithospermum erythrorhizon]|uniref:Uncharacterized protein n=1 Tax=Lithospermum erythrorhizon TaxID=34254 RepID=A0AAV3RX41_LITER